MSELLHAFSIYDSDAIVGIEEHHWEWVGGVMVVVVEVICCGIVYKNSGVFQHIDADERSVLVVTHVD